MLTSLLPELILSVAALLFPLLWHAASALAEQQLAKLPLNVQPLVRDIVTAGVHFVEQSFPELKGEDKKSQAMSVIQKMLSSNKLSVSPDEINVLIEEAVFLMNGGESNAPAASAAAPVGFAAPKG